jgi:uncharacterized membrane protein YdbT with pleckstrin-like domain
MPAMQVRPSTKFIRLGYIFCVMIAVGIAVFLETAGNTDSRLWWVLIVPGLLMFVVLIRHIRTRMMMLEILGDRVRLESGFLSKMTRTEQIVKLQDIRVDQSLGQRMVGVGDLSFETAGASSRIVMRSIDRPQVVADHIMELAKAPRLGDGGHPGSQGTP